MSTCVFMLVSHFPLSQYLIFLCHILLNIHETKCKVFEIIPHDLEGNHYKIVTFVYLHMFPSVAMKNIVTCVNEKVFCIIARMQTSDANVNKELGFDNSRGKDNAKGLNTNEILPLPPPIDNSRLGYVKRLNFFARSSTLKDQAFKKKGKKNTF